MPLIVVAAIVVAFQDANATDVVRGWRDNDPAQRDQSTSRALDGWRAWTDADLALFGEAARDVDKEVAQRAAAAVARIRIRRTLGKAVFAQMPHVDVALASGEVDRRVEVLGKAFDRYRRFELGDEALARLAEVVGTPAHQEAERILDIISGWSASPYLGLVRPLAGKRWTGRSVAVHALGSSGDRKYADEIAACLDEDDTSLHTSAVLALEQLGAREHAEKILRLLPKPHEPHMVILNVLGGWADPAHADAVAPLLKSRDTSIQLYAVRALAAMRSHWEDIEALAAAPDASVRIAVVEALGGSRQPAHARTVLSALTDVESSVQWAAVRALASRAEGFDRNEVTRVIRETQGESRRMAIMLLGRARARECAAEIEPLLASDDGPLRRTAATALGDMGCAPDGLVRMLDSKDIGDRACAAAALAEAGAIEYAERIGRLLPDVQGMAAEALGHLGARGREDDIAALLKSDSVVNQGKLARALADLRSTNHAADVSALLRGPNAELWLTVARALAEIGGDESVDGLIRVANINVGAKHFAVLALGCLRLKSDRERVVADLRQRLGDREWQTHHAAAISLIRLGVLDREGALRVLREPSTAGYRGALPFGDDLMEALAVAYEPETWKKYTTERTVRSLIETPDGLKEFFKEAGLKLDTSGLKAEGRVPPGIMCSPRWALRRLTSTSWRVHCFVIADGCVRLAAPDAAVADWLDRLERK